MSLAGRCGLRGGWRPRASARTSLFWVLTVVAVTCSGRHGIGDMWGHFYRRGRGRGLGSIKLRLGGRLGSSFPAPTHLEKNGAHHLGTMKITTAIMPNLPKDCGRTPKSTAMIHPLPRALQISRVTTDLTEQPVDPSPTRHHDYKSPAKHSP